MTDAHEPGAAPDPAICFRCSAGFGRGGAGELYRSASRGHTVQVVFHIVARPSLSESLRELIISDIQRWEEHYSLVIDSEKKVGRSGGWAKIKAKDLPGVINISWHAGSKTLTARAIAKQGNTPALLLGRFVGYLLECRRKDVRAITIHP